MAHQQGINNNQEPSTGYRRMKLTLAIVLTVMVAEIIGGIISGSLALLGDAGHMLVDGLALGIDAAALVIDGIVVTIAVWVDLIAQLIERIDELSGMSIAEIFEELTGIELPPWLEPGSPPPLYYALQDIGRAMDQLQFSATGGPARRWWPFSRRRHHEQRWLGGPSGSCSHVE